MMSFLPFSYSRPALAIFCWVGLDILGLGGCSRSTPKVASPSLKSTPAAMANPRLPQISVNETDDARLPLQIIPGEFTLALPPPAGTTEDFQSEESIFDPLFNLAIAPEDKENGWDWIWDNFRAMAPALRPTYLDQIASITPSQSWNHLDPILSNPDWGPEVLQTLFRRLMDLPLEQQIPRLLYIAKNPYHPCQEEASRLLQTYYPETKTSKY